MASSKPVTSPHPGLLMRLLRDQRGTTMAMMTAAVVPMIGMVGGALDMSRIYLVKSRMQQACDAGALAGRKRMGGGQWSQDGGQPNTVALNFFDSNFADNSYGTTGRTRAFAEAAGRVTGTASVTVPMTLMKVFNKQSHLVEVTCDAEMRLPNTDVMFVLDTTGSMTRDPAGTEVNGGPTSKIVALRSAVKCFYEIVARVDTAEVCSTGTPSGGVTTATQIRFGFVPYATNVNVGYLLPTTFFANSWPYQSREAITREVTENSSTTGTPIQTNDVPTIGAWTNNPSSNSTPFNGKNYRDVTSTGGACSAAPANDPINWTAESAPQGSNSSSAVNGDTTTTTTTWTTTQNGVEFDYDRETIGGSCFRGFWRTRPHTRTRTYSRVDTTTTTRYNEFVRWRYARRTFDVSALKNGTAWNTSLTAPIGNTNVGARAIAPKTVNWEGCIEERKTIRASTYTSTAGGTAKDLDLHTVPTTADPDSLWGPALHDLIYLRSSTANSIDDNDAGGFVYDPVESTTNFSHIEGPDADGNRRDNYHCPTAGRKLQVWGTTTTGSPAKLPFENYVDSLRTGGNTYHDIGLIWGARLMSPTGIFGSENALTPAGGEIERHLIFMTDGETCTGTTNYGPYGFAWFDRRQTDEGTAPTGGCETETSPGGSLTQQVNARYAAVCTAVKNMPNTTLWVIWFGQSKPNLEARLTTCATSGRFFAARDSAQLQTTFASIANQISQLRLTN